MKYRLNYENDLKKIISDEFNIDIDSLYKLDSCEGVLLTNNTVVFKCLTFYNEQNDLIQYSIKNNSLLSPNLKTLHKSFIDTQQSILHNYFKLKALSESIKNHEVERIIDFEVFHLKNYIILKMPFVTFSDYTGEYEDEMIELMKELKHIGWVCTDICPKNLKILDESGKILLIDIGFFFSPYYNDLFKTMCRRAFVSIYFVNSPQLKSLLRNANTDKELSFLSDDNDYINKYNKFYRKIG
jgi:hypothetical protein